MRIRTVNNLPKAIKADPKYQCDVCLKVFNRKGFLSRHKCKNEVRRTRKRKTDEAERPFSCTVCEAAFKTKGTLRQHQRLHTGVKPYVCELCQELFYNKCFLNDHMKNYHNKTYVCVECWKRFRNEHDIDKHMRTHITEMSELNVERVSHTSENMYVCEICLKEFSIKRYLTAHLCSHKGIPQANLRFICELCNKAFASRIHLEQHVCTHTGRRHMKHATTDETNAAEQDPYANKKNAHGNLTVKVLCIDDGEENVDVDKYISENDDDEEEYVDNDYEQYLFENDNGQDLSGDENDAGEAENDDKDFSVDVLNDMFRSSK